MQEWFRGAIPVENKSVASPACAVKSLTEIISSLNVATSIVLIVGVRIEGFKGELLEWLSETD